MPVLANDESLIGYVLADKYRVLRVIGKGGMGIVYEAEHVVLGKHVAIKLMLEKYFEDGEAKTRFKREAVAASKIGNPHIIDVIDIGELPDGRLYVVMELLNGRPLAEVLERGGPMQATRAIAIMRQVLRAVGAAHAKGIIHRDLKPDNIFLTDQGDGDFVKLLDFGISKVLDPDEQIALTKLTTTGVVMGTPLYMAPEQAMGQPAVAPADIYACGVILYEMLSGRTPFVGNTYAVLVAQLLTAPPEPLQNVRGGLPAALVSAVHRALEKEPNRRFPSAEMFAASLPGDRSPTEIELAGTLDSGYAVARIPTGAHQSGGKRRGTWIAIGGALVLGIATAGILIATQTGKGSGHGPEIGSEQAAAQPDVVPPPPVGKPEPTAPAKETGLLKVSSKPGGAHVFIDGTDRGRTPDSGTLDITLAVGKHDLKVELDGYETLETSTFIDPGSNSFTSPLAKKSATAPTRVSGTRPPTKPTGGGTTKPVKETPTATTSGSALTVTGPAVGPTRPPIEKPEVRAVPETKPPDKKPGDSGKGNPYTNPGTKNNPYTTPPK